MPTINPEKCLVLVPALSLEPDTRDLLVTLHARGYEVRELRGESAIDRARSSMATEAMRDGFEETFWIDADMRFDPDFVDVIRAHDLPMCAGLYVTKKNMRCIGKFGPNVRQVTFGVGGGLYDMTYVGMGFTHIRKCVYEEIGKDLPECGGCDGATMVPYFQPVIVHEQGTECYLSEDYSLCHRAAQAGFKIMSDTRLKIGHIGKKSYTWDDLMPQQTLETLNMQFAPALRRSADGKSLEVARP
jgi:hypothetical protein